MSSKLKLYKIEKDLLKQQAEQVIEEALRFSKKRFKHFDEVIDLLFSGTDLSRFYGADEKIRKVSECFRKVSSYDRKYLKDALKHLSDHSSLITCGDTIHAVYNMIRFRNKWCNNIFQWRPLVKGPASQMKELAHYLFCKYPVPDFLYKAFWVTIFYRRLPN